LAKFPHYNQYGSKDCGPTCLKIIAKYYGQSIAMAELKVLCETTRMGSTLLSLSEAAEKINFRTLGVKANYEQLVSEVSLPCIIHWQQKHYVVLYKIAANRLFVSDPAHGLLSYTKAEFIKHWLGTGASETDNNGICLLLEPAPQFYDADFEKEDKRGFRQVFRYITPYKRFFLQLGIGLFCSSLMQLAFPFLTQSIVDVGIQNRDLNFIYLILLAEIFLMIGTMSIELIRGWLLLHIGTRVNIAMISDFFIKLMKLPLSYFDTRISGDILQRINDHQRIQALLTVSSLNILFSILNVIVLGLVLASYSVTIFLIFLFFSTSYVVWTIMFFGRRKELDYKMFSQLSQDQSKVIEIISGMHEIKMNNSERQKRWTWEHIQASKFRIEIRRMTFSQIQSVGSFVIGQTQNILISILTAKLVIDGVITLGMMLAISYIVGQLNNPIRQFIGFSQTLQDAKISMERINEVHEMKTEDEHDSTLREDEVDFANDIVFENVSFRYPGAEKPAVENLSFVVPANSITAIVGSSGSGKTTIAKLLQKAYNPTTGSIKLGARDLKNIPNNFWRSNCGFVSSDGFIFSDTIAGNISMSDEGMDKTKLGRATSIASIDEFITELPQGYSTKLGSEGRNLSSGQKQRILIARAVYKDPTIVVFDEATSALDANNEKNIVANLSEFLERRTSVIIAHRLSTVKNADQVIVLENGQITEVGTHNDLLKKQGYYYDLVKNQLELEDFTA
jgi:ATP-binding cassette subfamily B protein